MKRKSEIKWLNFLSLSFFHRHFTHLPCLQLTINHLIQIASKTNWCAVETFTNHKSNKRSTERAIIRETHINSFHFLTCSLKLRGDDLPRALNASFVLINLNGLCKVSLLNNTFHSFLAAKNLWLSSYFTLLVRHQ